VPRARSSRGCCVALVLCCPWCLQAEAETLRRILPDYVRHVQAHRETMLSKYFSCTKMRLYTQTLYFVVMENVFRRCKDEIHERYDLKGSWVNRAGHTAAASSTVHCRYCQEQFKVCGWRRDHGSGRSWLLWWLWWWLCWWLLRVACCHESQHRRR